jgi:hypothetical protein
MNWFADWPYKWFAPFRATTCGADDPTLGAFIDEGWRYARKDQLVAYLRNCPLAAVTDSAGPVCPYCGEEGVSGWVTDGDWIWPADLAHMVEKHALRIPDGFVAHLEGAKFRVPPDYVLEGDNIPWPKSEDMRGLLRGSST